MDLRYESDVNSTKWTYLLRVEGGLDTECLTGNLVIDFYSESSRGNPFMVDTIPFFPELHNFPNFLARYRDQLYGVVPRTLKT